MMDWEPVYKVAMLSFLIGMVFGAVVNKTNFCTMGAVSDWVNMGNVMTNPDHPIKYEELN